MIVIKRSSRRSKIWVNRKQKGLVKALPFSSVSFYTDICPYYLQGQKHLFWKCFQGLPESGLFRGLNEEARTNLLNRMYSIFAHYGFRSVIAYLHNKLKLIDYTNCDTPHFERDDDTGLTPADALELARVMSE